MNLFLLMAMLGLVAADVAGQILLKHAADQSVGTSPGGSWRWIGLLLVNVKFLGGLSLLIFWYLGYLGILTRFELAKAFPMQSLGVLLLLLFSRCYLREKVGLTRWAGGALIAMGVLLLAI